MKKRIILVITFLLLCTLLPACRSYSSFEDYANKHDDIYDAFSSADRRSGLSMTVDGNTIICEYDVSGIKDVTEESALHEASITALEQSLSEKETYYSDLCKTLEEDSKMEDLVIIVRYVYKDTLLAERTFKSN